MIDCGRDDNPAVTASFHSSPSARRGRRNPPRCPPGARSSARREICPGRSTARGGRARPRVPAPAPLWQTHMDPWVLVASGRNMGTRGRNLRVAEPCLCGHGCNNRILIGDEDMFFRKTSQNGLRFFWFARGKKPQVLYTFGFRVLVVKAYAAKSTVPANGEFLEPILGFASRKHACKECVKQSSCFCYFGGH